MMSNGSCGSFCIIGAFAISSSTHFACCGGTSLVDGILNVELTRKKKKILRWPGLDGSANWNGATRCWYTLATKEDTLVLGGNDMPELLILWTFCGEAIHYFISLEVPVTVPEPVEVRMVAYDHLRRDSVMFSTSA